jgi:hypothetical protein
MGLLSFLGLDSPTENSGNDDPQWSELTDSERDAFEDSFTSEQKDAFEAQGKSPEDVYDDGDTFFEDGDES